MASSTTCVSSDGSEDAPASSGATDSTATDRASLRTMVRNAAREMESRIILETLAKHQWNRRRTAEALNISYRSLMYKMKDCKLRKSDCPREPEAG